MDIKLHIKAEQRMHRKKRINKKLQKKYGEKVCFDFR